MRRHLATAVTIAAMIVVAPATAPAKQAQRHPSAKANVVSKRNALDDAEFMKKVAQANMAEIDIGQVAVQHAKDPSVKQFAQRMSDDHTKANNQLMSIARKQGVSIPTQIGKEHQQKLNRLTKLSGDEFDKVYMRDMVNEHEHDVSLLQRHADVTHDTQLKAWIQDTLPTLKEHERLAKEDATKVGVNVVTGQAQGAPAGSVKTNRGQASR